MADSAARTPEGKMRPKKDSWHYHLYDETFLFFYGTGNAPEEPSLVAYLWRLLVVFPFQRLLLLFLLFMMLVMTIFINIFSVPLGIGLFFVDGDPIPFRFTVRGRKIRLWTIVIPFYLLTFFVLVAGMFAIWCISGVALCVLGFIFYRSTWLSSRLPTRFQMI